MIGTSTSLPMHSGERQGGSMVESSPVPPECRLCGREKPGKVFDLPVLDGPYESEIEWTVRSFYRCSNCGYLFVYPLEAERYAKHYAALDATYHQDHDQETSRYFLIRKVLEPVSVRCVLDWGCGRGTFLSAFPNNIEKYGVELSSAAALQAERRNVHIVSPKDIDGGKFDEYFDAVTAIDVVEHVSDLVSFRNTVARALRPGGTLVLLTGNLDSSVARILGRYWYYIHYGEHISCLTERAAQEWLEPDFETVTIQRVTHHKSSYIALLRTVLIFPVAWMFEKLGLARKLRVSAKLFLDSDHMLVTARRKGC